jgi:hypothetical protein
MGVGRAAAALRLAGCGGGCGAPTWHSRWLVRASDTARDDTPAAEAASVRLTASLAPAANRVVMSQPLPGPRPNQANHTNIVPSDDSTPELPADDVCVCGGGWGSEEGRARADARAVLDPAAAGCVRALQQAGAPVLSQPARQAGMRRRPHWPAAGQHHAPGMGSTEPSVWKRPWRGPMK